MRQNDCPCHVCNPRAPREPGTPHGLNAQGEFKQPSTYRPEFADERWDIRMERLMREREKQEREEKERAWAEFVAAMEEG